VSGAEVRQAALAVADDIWNAAQWMGDALAGEFAHKRTVGQIVVDAVISMIPVAGEITAARDCVAITLRLSEKPEAREDRWEWVSLVLCLLAVVPVLGGILKGVGKLLIRAAVKSEDLVQLGREILAFLRKMGYGDAHEWLQKLDFAKYQTEVVKGFNEMLSRLGRGAEFVTGSMRAYLPFVVWLFLKELPPKLEEVRQLGGRMIPQGIKDLNQLLDRVRQKLVEGTWADITIGTDGARVMTEEARLVEMAKDMGVSLGHKAVPRRSEWKSGDLLLDGGGARWSLWAADGLWAGAWATRQGCPSGRPQVSASALSREARASGPAHKSTGRMFGTAGVMT
jgi:hypothetical protein